MAPALELFIMAICRLVNNILYQRLSTRGFVKNDLLTLRCQRMIPGVSVIIPAIAPCMFVSSSQQ